MSSSERAGGQGTRNRRSAHSIPPTPERGTDRPGNHGVGAEWRQLIELAQQWDGEREREQQRHRRAQPKASET